MLRPKVIYEDNHLLVVEKPPNVLSQADHTGDLDMLSIGKAYIKEKYNKPGAVFLGLVQRLDRPVGGVMVFARTSKAAARLSAQIREGTLGKTYLAVIRGDLGSAEGTLCHHLTKDPHTNIVTVSKASTSQSKEAVLKYKRLSSNAGLTLVEVTLITGRSHQIRVQFAHEGHPLYGDQKYGAAQNVPGQQIALWSYRLEFQHPTTQERLSFCAPPPSAKPWVELLKT